MKHCKVIFVFLLLPALAVGTGGGRRDAGPDMTRVGMCRDRITSRLHASTGTSVVPSAVAVIVDRDGVLLSAGSGADMNTPFGIASLSKIFTSIIVLSLCQDGLMRLDDPVERYVPGIFSVPSGVDHGRVTVHHLLAHTSGIPSTAPNREPVPVVYPGGTCYEYANAGYCILKKVIEKASSRSYEELVRERIFIPLSMTSSRADCSNGTGGIISTAADLSRFAMMLIKRGTLDGYRILTEDSFDEMLAPTLPMPPGDDDYYYSLGWEVVRKDGRVGTFYKAGRWYGEGSALQVFPEEGGAILYLCNPPYHLSAAYMSWRDSLMAVMRKSMVEIYGVRGKSLWPLKLYPRRERYAGVYMDASGRRITVFESGGTLGVIREGRSIALSPFSSLRYLDPSGRVYSFVWKNDRMEAVAAGKRYYLLAR